MSKSQTPKAPRRKYDEEFKNEAVRLVTTSTRSVPDLARSLGISENLLYRWKGYSKPNELQKEITQQDYDQFNCGSNCVELNKSAILNNHLLCRWLFNQNLHN